MNFSSSQGGFTKGGGNRDADRGARILGFPESFHRTSSLGVLEREDAMFDDAAELRPSPDRSHRVFQEELDEREEEIPIPRRFARSNVMRLENILNSVSIGEEPQYRSRSLSPSPLQTEFNEFHSSSHPTNSGERSRSPDGFEIKKKKVKMHKCPECQKEFPRPSGLRTHMNIHTKEKPFGCTYPGCERTFSVVSNAKRHMRSHGMGVNSDDAEISNMPYIIGFEPPVVVPPPDIDTTMKKTEPLQLKWPSSAVEQLTQSPSPSAERGFEFSTHRSRPSLRIIENKGFKKG